MSVDMTSRWTYSQRSSTFSVAYHFSPGLCLAALRRRARTSRRRWARLAVAQVREGPVKMRGPKSEQSAPDGQDAFEDSANRLRDIGQDLLGGRRAVRGRQVELLLPLETRFR